MDWETIGILIGSWALLEGVKFLASNKKSALIPNEQRALKDIHDILSRTDSGGKPLIYFPTHLEEDHQRIAEHMLRVALILEGITKTLEKIMDKLEK